MHNQNKITISDATHRWVNEFNKFPYSMISKLCEVDIDSWHEVTLPSVGDRVCVYSLPDEDIDGNGLETSERCGEIESIIEDEEDTYIVCSDGNVKIKVEASDIEVERDGFLPMWGTMWQFGDNCDDYWLIEQNGIQLMSNCGFRIYEHDEWGYFFGIDGAGYDFYEAHWIPLYKARGLKWHNVDESEDD